jgi:hypothetical protein
VIECPGCGRKVSDGTLFCPSCRYLLRPIAAAARSTGDPGCATREEAPPPTGTAIPSRMEIRATLQAGFALWRAARRPLMWLAAIGLFASIPISVLAAATGFDPLSAASYTPLAILGMALAVLLGLPFAVGSAAGSLIVLAESARGRTAQANPFAAFVRGCLLFKRVLGAWVAMVAVGALVATPAVVVWLGMDVASPLRTPLAAIFSLFAAVVGVFLWIRWAPTTAVLVLEGRRPLEALLRAAALTRGRFFRVMGVVAAVALVSFAAQIVSGIFGGAPEVAQIIAMVLDVVLVGPLSAAIAFALYLGLARS